METDDEMEGKTALTGLRGDGWPCRWLMERGGPAEKNKAGVIIQRGCDQSPFIGFSKICKTE
jgi:hypothetical protein